MTRQACAATGRLVLGDNLPVLKGLADCSVDLVYADPPFNTGKARRHARQKAERDPESTRAGFGGQVYRLEIDGEERGYADAFDDYLGFLEPRLREIHRVLAAHGSLYLHVDPRESHYVKVLLDRIFGRAAFLNEIVWAYDFGGRPKSRWPAKHDVILFYAKTPGQHRFDQEAVERIPYMAPGLAGPEKAARGKLPTDVWWHTIVPTSGHERTGYPTQKPLGVLRRIVAASSAPGDLVLDPFAGSGTTGAACMELGRRFLLIDDNPEAHQVMTARLAEALA